MALEYRNCFGIAEYGNIFICAPAFNFVSAALDCIITYNVELDTVDQFR